MSRLIDPLNGTICKVEGVDASGRGSSRDPELSIFPIQQPYVLEESGPRRPRGADPVVFLVELKRLGQGTLDGKNDCPP